MRHRLQELSIGCIDYARNEHLQGPQPHFDTAPLAQLPRLARLELQGFSSFDLRGLPPSLRCLRAVGDASLTDEFPAPETWRIPDACGWAAADVHPGTCSSSLSGSCLQAAA